MKFKDADFTDVAAASIAAGLGATAGAGTIATRAYEVAEALEKERVERVAERNRATPDAPAASR